MVVRRLVYLATAIGAMIIVSTRFHYTLDVAIGLYLTQRTFRYYHDAALYPNLLKDSPMASFLRWMEAEDIWRSTKRRTGFTATRREGEKMGRGSCMSCV